VILGKFAIRAKDYLYKSETEAVNESIIQYQQIQRLTMALISLVHNKAPIQINFLANARVLNP